jgi:Fic family protein
MQPSSFTRDAPGELVKHPDGYWTFVPLPLPPHLSFSPPLVRALSEADQALGQLSGVGRMLPNPHLLIRPFLGREAVSSSRIEGTVAGLKDLLLYEMNPDIRPTAPDVREVANYVAALEYGLERLKELPICLRLIRELHERLLRGVRGADHQPGEFRRCQNFIGRQGQKAHQARFVPPTVAHMDTALHALERFIAAPGDLPVLVQVALIHYQFEAIHPFEDGNGRVGRLLISLLLCERKCLPQPLLYLSTYLERHDDEYKDHLLRVSQRGAWDEWITFFLRGVAEQSRDAVARSHRLLDLWQTYRQNLQGKRTSALTLRLVDTLFETVMLTIPRAAELLGVTYASAKQNLERLVLEGIVDRLPNSRPQTYFAHNILRTLEDADDAPPPDIAEATPGEPTAE